MRLLISSTDCTEDLKTMTAMNLAVSFANKGQSVLLADGSSNGKISEMIGLSETGMALDRSGKQILRDSDIGDLRVWTGLHEALKSKEGADKLFQRLRDLSKEKEITIINLPPSTDESVLMFGTTLIHVVSAQQTSVEGIHHTLAKVMNVKNSLPDFNFKGFVIYESENYDEGADVTLRWLADEFPKAMLWGRIQIDKTLTESMDKMIPVGQLDSDEFAEPLFSAISNNLFEEPIEHGTENLDMAQTLMDRVSPSSSDMIKAVQNFETSHTLPSGEPARTASGELDSEGSGIAVAVDNEEKSEKEKNPQSASMFGWLSRLFK